MNNRLRCVFILIVLMSGTAQAEDRINLNETTITGNQEQPRVTYILPWQQPSMPNLADPPLDQLIDEALTPVDREVFRRQLHYYRVFSATQSPRESPDTSSE